MDNAVNCVQVSDVVVPGQSAVSAREALLLWARRTVSAYPDIRIRDFSTSWRDGRAFLAVIHRHRYTCPEYQLFAAVNLKTACDNSFFSFCNL